MCNNHVIVGCYLYIYKLLTSYNVGQKGLSVIIRHA